MKVALSNLQIFYILFLFCHQERSKIIATYALCGFSNFSSIGIQLGGLGPLAPSRKTDLATLAFRALIAGTIACFMTACIAGKVIIYSLIVTNHKIFCLHCVFLRCGSF